MMKLLIEKDSKALGKAAAKVIAEKLNAAIRKNGAARIVLSTGASQFDTIEALIREDVDWTRVTMFHLDEYVGLSESHKASFRKYLKERFASRVPLAAAHYVNGEGDVQANIAALTKELCAAPVDVGVIGIGENAHIAFNDPPADFETKESYWVVDLAERCKQQQVGEGWFENVEAVPRQAISMTPYRIMQCRCIVSCVPHKVKAEAIRATLAADHTDPNVPATLLKEHPDFYLFIDGDSASACDEALLEKAAG